MLSLNRNLRQSGMSVMEILIAGLLLITISGGLGSIALNQRAAETKASALSSQHALIVTLLQKVNTREVLLASAPESSPLGSCIRGENCRNLAGRRTPISFRKGQEIFSGNEGAAGRLFTPAGAPCGQTFGTPTAACPLSVTSAVTVRCVGNCTRPQYVYAHFNIDYCEPGRPCNQQNVRRLSTDQYAGSLLGIENVLVADCTPLDRENHPDAVDQGRGSQRRRSITEFDTSFLFGFNEAFSEDFPSLNDRDYDTYCRKLRVRTNSCNPQDGGVAIGFTRDARLVCTERSGWGGAPPPLPPVVVIPTPTPTPAPRCVAARTDYWLGRYNMHPPEHVVEKDTRRAPQDRTVAWSYEPNVGTRCDSGAAVSEVNVHFRGYNAGYGNVENYCVTSGGEYSFPHAGMYHQILLNRQDPTLQCNGNSVMTGMWINFRGLNAGTGNLEIWCTPLPPHLTKGASRHLTMHNTDATSLACNRANEVVEAVHVNFRGMNAGWGNLEIRCRRIICR